MKSALSVTLSIYAEAASEAPRQITNLDHFTNRPFDDLWQEAITPKYQTRQKLCR